MKITIYGICKNEYKHVERFMESAKEADGVYLCDTGSTDGTQELLRQKGAVVDDITVKPWRFDLARNMSLIQVPEDTDVCISLDLDEILLEGWRAELKKIWENGITRVRYPYVFNWQDEKQTIPNLSMQGFKIHTRHGFTWRYPVHEVLIYEGEEKEVCTQKIICHHHPDLDKPRGYQSILDWAVKDNPNCPRMSRLRGRELWMFGNPKEAIAELRRYLMITESTGFDFGGETQERSMAMRHIARSLKALDADRDEILLWMLRANAECPYTRESWVWLAQAWYDVGDMIQTIACIKTGLRITDRKLSIENEEMCWNDYPIKLMQMATENINRRTA